ncbi:hypothetical protein [Paenarthrobacter sp. NPDC018779]|uniref:hypothetical protein n=1 Tax=Paenarthrobacter sp. NPDC018779 TaxID=3364375 RepID=UPI0037C57655
MGIRYYAFAFDGDMTDRVLADPRSVMSSDPLADAWGFEPGAEVGFPTFEQSIPERDMLYLDKAWRELQAFTAPSRTGADARPAFRMFEGEVTMHYDGWESWIRVLPPMDVPAIAQDLSDITDAELGNWLQGSLRFQRDSNVSYAVGYLQRARAFVNDLAASDRGFVYLIG